jgi:hypothetical protein
MNPSKNRAIPVMQGLIAIRQDLEIVLFVQLKPISRKMGAVHV